MWYPVNPERADSRGRRGHSVKRTRWFSRRVLGDKFVFAGIMAVLVAAATALPIQADQPVLSVEYSSTGKGYLAYGGVPVLAYGPGDEMRIIQGGPADVTRWANWQRDNGMNLIRAYPTVMPLSAYGSPGPHPFHSAGGGKWNVDAFNDAYFDAMGAVASALEERGIILHLQLFSHWPFKAGSGRWDICYVNPKNNVNSWTDGFTSGDHYLGAYTTAARNHQRIWIEKILNAMKGRGNVFIDICNELGGTGTNMAWAAERAGWIREWEAQNDWNFIVGVGGGHTTYGSYHNSFDIFIHNELRTVSRVRDSVIATGWMPAVSVRSSDGTNNWSDYLFADASQVGPEHQTRYRTLCYRSIFAGLQSIGAYWKPEVSQADYLNMQHWPVYAQALRSFWGRISPYWPELEPDDSIISNAVTPNAYGLKSDELYVVYLECGSHTHNNSYPASTIRIEYPFDLNSLEIELFNPRTGEITPGQATRVGTAVDIPLPAFIDDFIVIMYYADSEPPSVPTDVQATSWGSTVMDITWTASTDNAGVAGYKIFRNETQIDTTTGTYYLDTGLTPSTTYSYTVSAYDFAGNESAQSAPALGTTLAPDSQPPSVPTNVTANALSGDSIQVTWTASTDNRGVMGYKVFRNGSIISTIGKTTSYTDSGLLANTSYSYTVSAFDGDGNDSAQSSPPAVATTLGTIVINNLVPSNYVVTTFDIGSLTFIDRDFAITSMPTRYRGLKGIRTANNDKDKTNLDFRFDINQPLDVYICLQNPMQPTTPLLSGFVSTGHTLQTTDVGTNIYTIFRKAYPAGEVNLGPKPGAGDGKSMYFVLLDYPEDSQPPSVPTDVMAAAQSETSIHVTWTASTDNIGVAGYKIFRNGNQVGTSGTTVYLDTGLSAGTTYSYTVSAYDAAGNNSPQSSPAAVATTPDNTPPSIPTNVVATALSGSEIQVSWTASTDNVGVAGYRIFRNGAEVGTTGGSTSYIDSGLQEATVYTYTVSAFDAASNESAQSAPATAMTFDADPPSVPADVQGVSLTPTIVKLTWTASTDNVGVAGYKVFRDGVGIGTTAETEYVDTDLSPDTTYAYTVSAYDESDNESAQSSPATVATLAALTIAEAKLQGDNSVVGMVSKRVSAVWDDCFYIQEDDRHAGIKIVPVEMPDGLMAGSFVEIGGVLDTDENSERFVLGVVLLR